MPRDRRRASVGPLTFDDDFADPLVDVDRENNTVSHETVNDDYIIQVMGRKPPSISVEGVIYEEQLPLADMLPAEGVVEVRTERFTGMAVVEAVSTPFRRESDPGTGRWVHDITIDMLAVSGSIPFDGDIAEDLQTENIRQLNSALGQGLQGD